MGRKTGKTMTLHHLATNLQVLSTLFKLTNEISRFVQDLERTNKNFGSKFSKGTVSDISYGWKYKKQYCLMWKNQ